MDIAKTLGSLSHKEMAAIAVGGLGIGYIWRKRSKANSGGSTVTASGDTLASGSGLLNGAVPGSTIGGGSGSSSTDAGTVPSDPTIPDVPANPGSIPLPPVTWTVTIGGQQYETDGTSYWPIGSPADAGYTGSGYSGSVFTADPGVQPVLGLQVGTTYGHLTGTFANGRSAILNTLYPATPAPVVSVAPAPAPSLAAGSWLTRGGVAQLGAPAATPAPAPGGFAVMAKAIAAKVAPKPVAKPATTASSSISKVSAKF